MEKGTYTGLIEALNSIRIQRWIIRAGMGFGAIEKWWAEGIRTVPHNGLDLRLYEDARDRREAALDASTLVPALESGEVVAIIGDFLGESVFIAHAGGMVSAYGHLRPSCKVREKVGRGQAIATLSERPGISVPPHLHLSLLRLPEGFELAGLTWQGLDETDGVEYLDPAGVISRPL